MSEPKCPFCQQELIPCIKNQNDWIYHCDNLKCPMYDDADNENTKHLLASKELWEELMLTRKTLDVAVDKLKGIKDECYDTTDVLLYVNKALEEITALKQRIKQ